VRAAPLPHCAGDSGGAARPAAAAGSATAARTDGQWQRRVVVAAAACAAQRAPLRIGGLACALGMEPATPGCEHVRAGTHRVAARRRTATHSSGHAHGSAGARPHAAAAADGWSGPRLPATTRCHLARPAASAVLARPRPPARAAGGFSETRRRGHAQRQRGNGIVSYRATRACGSSSRLTSAAAPLLVGARRRTAKRAAPARRRPRRRPAQSAAPLWCVERPAGGLGGAAGGRSRLCLCVRGIAGYVRVCGELCNGDV